MTSCRYKPIAYYRRFLQFLMIIIYYASRLTVIQQYRLPYNLYCVGGDVKHCTINQSINQVIQQGILQMKSLACHLVRIIS